MSRFLLACWSFPGHIRPSLVLARGLRRRGHRVAFYTGPRGREAVEREGFECFGFERVDEDTLYARMFPETEPAASLRSPLRFFRALRHWLLETVPAQAEDLSRILRRWPPAALVSDVTLWAPFLILSETTRCPVAVLAFAPGCMIPHPRLPPWGLGISPPEARWKGLPYRVAVGLHGLTAERFRREANRLRRARGLPDLSVPVNAHLGTMPLYLIPSARELDDPREDLPPSVRYVGPLTEEGPGTGARLPDWFSSLRPGVPRIHVTEGTVSFQQPFLLRAAVEGLGDRDVELILTTGRERELGFLNGSRVPANLRLETFIPHEVLLPELDCLVTTGGAGTVLTALRHGVPMVVVPTEWDKPDNARHVRNVGAGVVLPPRRCDGERLRLAVEEVLGDPRYRESASRMGTVLKRYRGAEAAAEALEGLCGSEPGS